MALAKFIASNLLLLSVCLPAFAVPVIKSGGIVNAASFRNPAVAGSGLARGALATAFGTGLGPTQSVTANT